MMAQGLVGLFLLGPTFCAVSCAQETTMMAIGDVALEVDSTDRDTGLGDTFFVAVKSGANNCYVESLAKSPGQRGEIAFVVRPPPGEGYYLVTIEAKGSISGALAACVRGVFGGFYHYADHPAFDSLKGTLTFVPKMIPVPVPPTEAALRALLDEKYARHRIVRIAQATLKSVSFDVDEPKIFRRSYYEVDLEFIADGYEATCHHFTDYKVFGSKPYKSPYMGHSCENQARKAGDHTTDGSEIDQRLTYYPSVAKRWEARLVNEQHLGTRPAGGPGDD